MRRKISAGATALLFILVAHPTLSAQDGQISGTVRDVEGQPIAYAAIQLLGRGGGAYSTDSGEFTLKKLSAGSYSLLVSHGAYHADTVENLVVTAGGVTRVTVTMQEQIHEGGTITVTADPVRKSYAGAYAIQQSMHAVANVTSAEQISATGASDAKGAIVSQVGVTVKGDNPIVRGLGERYNNTQLDGTTLASPEPERKSVPFDLFPAGMIDNLITVKTFTPDSPGDFAGGLVKIETKDFPDHTIFNVGYSTGLNTETQGAEALTYNGGGLDWLGFDDGTRALPDGIERENRFAPEEQAELLSKFDRAAWMPTTANLPVNQSFSLTLGNSFGEENPIGILLSGSYASKFSYNEGLELSPLLSFDTEGRRELLYDYHTREAEHSVLWGSLLNLSYGLDKGSVIGLKAMYNQSAEDVTTLVTGEFNSSSTGQVRRTQLHFVERSIASAQLSGEHENDLLSRDSRIEWRAAISAAGRTQPDQRSTAYLRRNESDVYRYNGNFGSGNGRFFSDLDDIEYNGGLDWLLPLYFGESIDTRTRLKVGGVARMKERDFSARRFIFSPGTGSLDVLALDPEELFTPDHVATGAIGYNEATGATDAYDATETVIAGYAMIETPVIGNLDFIGGVRVERWEMDLLPFNQIIDQPLSNLRVDKSLIDILPSANFIYNLSSDMKLRGAFSQTLARPEFRELAPFRFDDYLQSTFGNPSLERTTILNYDLRWEFYPRPGEVLAVSGFYKDFTNPIEQFYLLGASSIQVEPVNASGATTYGIEFEARKSLDNVAEFLEDFAVGGNLALIKSTIRFDPNDPIEVFDGIRISEYSSAVLSSSERPLQGQSPYVINLMMGYSNRELGTDLNVMYNIFGERLATVGTQGYPDIYEQARPSLDVTLFQTLPSGLKLSLKGTNLLDSQVRYTQAFAEGEPLNVRSYFDGRSFSIGISFSLNQMKVQRSGT